MHCALFSILILWREVFGVLLAKISDNIMTARSFDEVQKFAVRMKNRFEVSKIIIDDDIILNGCQISQKVNGDIKLSM